MRAIFVFFVLALGLSASAASTAQTKSFGCLDENELVPWKAGLSSKQRKLLASSNELYGASLHQLERQLASAVEGDPVARRYVAQSWTLCQVFWGDLTEQKLARALEYHETSDLAGSRFNGSVLAMYYGMGWGRARDTARAVPLLMARHQLENLDAFAADEGIASAPSEQRENAFLLRNLIESALVPRLHRDWPRLVKGRAEQVSVTVSIEGCPIRTEVQPGTDAAVDQAMLSARMNELLKGYPTEGLPCRYDDGTPYQMHVVFELSRPEYSPFETQ